MNIRLESKVTQRATDDRHLTATDFLPYLAIYSSVVSAISMQLWTRVRVPTS